MSSLLASQLQAIKAVVQADTEPSKRPYTRPSILFSPKEAADFDIESIYELGLKGLLSNFRDSLIVKQAAAMIELSSLLIHSQVSKCLETRMSGLSTS